MMNTAGTTGGKLPSALRMVWSLLSKREKKVALGVLFLMIVAAASSVLMISLIGPFLFLLTNPDLIHTQDPLIWLQTISGLETEKAVILAVGALAFLAILAANVIGLVRTYCVARFSMMRVHSISEKLFRLQLRQPYEDFMVTSHSEIVKTTLGESGELVSKYLQPLGEMIASIISVSFIVSFMMYVYPYQTASVLGFFAIGYGTITVLSRKSLIRIGRERVEHSHNRAKSVNEAVRCIREIKMAGQEAEFQSSFRTASLGMLRAQVKVEVSQKLPRYWLQTLFFGGVIGYCMWLVATSDGASDEMITASLPMVGMLVFAGQRILPEVQSIFGALNKLAFGLPAVEAVWLRVRALEAGAQNVVAHQRLRSENMISLEAVSYRYPGQAAPVLSDISLDIAAGSRVGFVGPSGSGKSSLINILLGLTVPGSGVLRVDGKGLVPHDLPSWRQGVAQVPQEVVVLSTSLRRNVALGLPDEEIDDERVMDALRRARLAEWAASLESGLDTVVMSGMAAMSGGQRQRLGIARAIYRQADIIMLDEATSALDMKTEREIMGEIEEIFAGKTVFAIAHRTETLRNFDRIICLEEGHVSFDGSWEDWQARQAAEAQAPELGC